MLATLLSTFFKVTGLLLILFAAGLLAHGIHEFQEADIIPVVIEHVWDINQVLPEASVVGRFLSAIFGYNANPSLLKVITYCVFLGFTLVSYYYPDKGEKIVLHCRSDSMSAIAAKTLVKLGFTNVWNLAGGMVEWEKQGYELIRKPQ